mgnify:FL=1
MIEDINLKVEIPLGIFIGLIFIILNATLGIVIGIPLLAFSSETERVAVQSGVAPLGEELGFRAFLPFVLFIIGVPFILNLLINIVSFPLYHYYAYGESFVSASSLFIGAGLFALVAFLATYYNSDYDELQIPIAAIIAHAVINTWLAVKASGLLVVAS